MKILYVVSSPLEINSSASLRNISTINGLCDLGHDVTVVTGYPDKNHPQYSIIQLNEFAKLIYTSPNIMKGLSAKFYKNSVLRSLRSLIYKCYSNHNIYDSWKYVVYDKVWEELSNENYDILISSADPKSSHLAAEKFLEICNIPWIQIWGDPFTEDITNQNSKNEYLRRQEEKRLLNKATKAVYLSELTTIDIQQKYPDLRNKISFMPRPYIEEKISTIRDYCGGKLKIAYCGDYNSNVRNIIPLYEAVKETKDSLTICGNSNSEMKGTTDIDVLGRVNSEKVQKIEFESDVLVHLSNLKGYQIPGKIYNYSATNKPIIFILDGEADKIKACFEKYNRYLFCENTKSGIIKALNIIRTNSYPYELKPVLDFSYRMVLKKLIDIQ